MGLQISKTLLSNVTGDYWRIIAVNYNPKNSRASVQIAFYTSKIDRDAGKDAIKVFSYNWNSANYPFTITAMDAVGKNPTEIAYDKIKLLTDLFGLDFTTSTDV